MSGPFEPTIAVFLCNWYYHAEVNGLASAPPNVLPIRVLCSGLVSPEMILRTFRIGVDGVLVLGCSAGDCHYISSGYHAATRAPLVRDLVDYVSIHPGRLRLDRVSLEEPFRFVQVTQEFAEVVRALGPVGEEMGF
jgi:F420-non-reducing hydrogenase iron-sulfur subunit